LNRGIATGDFEGVATIEMALRDDVLLLVAVLLLQLLARSVSIRRAASLTGSLLLFGWLPLKSLAAFLAALRLRVLRRMMLI
jgi:hypothetical protein